MGKIIGLLFCITILFSCKKDKVPFPCTGISMLGDRSVFAGKWRWYKTTIEQWFDLGPSIYSDYTPQNQGYSYYFTISEVGVFKGYKNNLLVDDFVLNEVQYEIFSSTTLHGMRISLNCTESQINISIDPSKSVDTLTIPEYPLDFEDESNKLKSLSNYFVRE